MTRFQIAQVLSILMSLTAASLSALAPIHTVAIA